MNAYQKLCDFGQAEIQNAARSAGQVVLVLQGGGALGAYQAGVYQALHEAGLNRTGLSARRLAPSTQA